MIRSPQRLVVTTSVVAVVAVMALLAVGCGGDEADPSSDGEPDAAADAVGEASDPGSTFRRGCETPDGARPLGSRSPREHVRVAPVTFLGAPAAARKKERSWFRQSGTSWSAMKTVTQVSPSVEATVHVHPEARSEFLLIYDTENFRRNQAYRRSDGYVTVVFEACPGAEPPSDAAEFNGGFIARRPGCYRISVASELDPEPVTEVVNIAMGHGGCDEDG